MRYYLKRKLAIHRREFHKWVDSIPPHKVIVFLILFSPVLFPFALANEVFKDLDI